MPIGAFFAVLAKRAQGFSTVADGYFLGRSVKNGSRSRKKIPILDFLGILILKILIFWILKILI